MAKPPFPWIGSKEKLAPYILPAFPPKLRQYVEPFGGSGAVLLALPPDSNRLDIYNDLDSELVNLFSCIKERSNVLMRELKFLPINIEGSESIHSFHKNGTDKSLYVFEAPIDLLSHITLYPYGWLEHSYVACCGTSIQPVLERLRQNPKLDTVYLCLDNDDAGNDACDRMRDALEDMGLDVERLTPRRKDWNDDLCAKFEKHKEDAT